MYAFWRWFISVLFPPKCVHCAVPGAYLCEECFNNIEYLDKQYCPACNNPSILGYKSHGCSSRSYLDQLISVAWYRGVLRSLITKFKYGASIRVLEKEINKLIKLSVEPTLFSKEAVLVPVPLHPARFRARGFNQAQIIVKLLSKHLGLAADLNLLKRVVNTQKQSREPSYKERRKNIKDAFIVNDNVSLQLYTHVVLVDDVYTSGSTLEECAKTLKKANPNLFVSGFTLARG